ncbi:hypothetical protein HEK616_78220 (plasmid) [Streptomyces nigrescens]|uniref:Uncharacterized protein n=1 Tax=Streptomyces nigrescens TaxID=1920 RepID=A0ABN6R7H0_STRNI|nr:hypothetical protein HEK616_78220 [Streptomyces nigrescens]
MSGRMTSSVMEKTVLRESDALPDQTCNARWTGRERTVVVMVIALASFLVITGVRSP